jgi:acetyl esterase
MANSNSAHRPFRPLAEFQAILDLTNSIGNDLDTMTRENVTALRLIREQRAQRFLRNIPLEAVREFRAGPNHHPVPVRLFVPHGKQLARAGKLPLVIFFHGGGWTLGNPMIYDSITRYLAKEIPALVLSVDYRLGPEHPFPAAIEDADAVLQWVGRHAGEINADPARVVVAGDSAGGTLATVAARHWVAAGCQPLVMQLLIYPSTNISSTDYESCREYGTDHLLTQKAVEKFREFYLPNASDWTQADASPLLAEDLGGLPPVLLIAAGCDPLRDEGKAYAQKLTEQRVRVAYRLEPQLIHAFLSLFNLEPACSPYAEEILRYAAGVVRGELQTLPLSS